MQEGLDFPIAVIGAGPIGMVAASHIIARGGRPLILERGDRVGANVREWAHVRLFSPWKWIIDPVARAFLSEARFPLPDPEGVPTGAQLLSEFIEPLAVAIFAEGYLHLRHRVVTIAKSKHFERSQTSRAQKPFELISRTPSGLVTLRASAVIDASGTWLNPNPLGATGELAPGELENQDLISYRLPDVLGGYSRYKGLRNAVIGGGHTAANLLIDISEINSTAHHTSWIIRSSFDTRIYGRGEADALTGRAQLGQRVRELVARGQVRVTDSFPIARISRVGQALILETADGRRTGPFDHVFAATGFSPDHSLSRWLHVDHDPKLGAPLRLAPFIDPATHPWGTEFLHGYTHLAHREMNYFTVGMKSYGRAPSFDLLTGCEQVRSVVAHLMGDAPAANRIEAVYPRAQAKRAETNLFRDTATYNCGRSRRIYNPAQTRTNYANVERS